MTFIMSNIIGLSIGLTSKGKEKDDDGGAAFKNSLVHRTRTSYTLLCISVFVFPVVGVAVGIAIASFLAVQNGIKLNTTGVLKVAGCYLLSCYLLSCYCWPCL